MPTFPVTPLGEEDDSSAVSYRVNVGLEHYTGATLVVGDTVFLSDAGVEVLASTGGSYDAVNAYSFRNAAGAEIGGLYGRDDAGQNVVGLRALDAAGAEDDTTLELAASCAAAGTAVLDLQAARAGEATDCYIHLERGEGASAIDLISGDRVRLKPALNLLGAGNETADLYLKGSYLIVRYDDGGTLRYKYLDLSGAGASWAAGTAEP